LFGEVSRLVSYRYELPETFDGLLLHLRRALQVDLLSLALPDEHCSSMRVRYSRSSEVVQAELPSELPIADSPSGTAWSTQEIVLISDVANERRWPQFIQHLGLAGLGTYCVLPLTAGDRRLGAFAVGSLQTRAYSEQHLQLLREITIPVAMAVENELVREYADKYKRELTQARDHSALLLEVNNMLVSNLELPSLFRAISAGIQRVVKHDYSSLSLYDPKQQQFRVHALDFPGGRGVIKEKVVFAADNAPAGEALRKRKPLLVDQLALSRFPSDVTKWLLSEGIQSACWVPLIHSEKVVAVLNVASLHPHSFSAADVKVLTDVAPQIAIAVENALAFREIADLKDRLSKEKVYLESEIRAQYNFEEMIGESPAWRRVLQQLVTVAPTEANVLLLGETGTGKELLARAIHNQSPRRERTFVKLSCAAVPTGLLESELFGHEKGAFTGALTQQVGRFELANHGTLFLDEVGDIAPELQPKLLRALQEQEFERLGNPRTIKVDARVVAATNRDLGHMVAERTFREDLYYRLNVFPIVVPPLRERAGDVELLVRFFAAKYAARMHRQVEDIPKSTLKALCRYHWPGNVRELEHFIERAVILSTGKTLQVPLDDLRLGTANIKIEPLVDTEREHILQALRACDGVLGGPTGAAARLGINRSTLNSRMRKLGISRKDV